MIDFLNAVPNGLTSFTLLIFILGGLVTAVWKGLLIPRPFHEDRINDRDVQIERLLEASEFDRETVRRSQEGFSTMIQLLEEIQQRGRGGDSP